MTLDPNATSSRRRLLAAAAGGAAALAIEALARPLPSNATSSALMTETDNPVSGKTSMSASSSITTEEGVAFEATVGDLGTAIHGVGVSGAGVRGSTENGIGVVGQSLTGDGVHGFVGDPAQDPGRGGAGVSGSSGTTDAVGVFGDGPVGVQGAGQIAVLGIGESGVVGWGDGLGAPGDYGTGIFGYSGSQTIPAPPHNVGVYARGDGASTALRVQGKAIFSRSGRTSFTAGHSSKVVTYAGVTSSSLVIATLQTYRSGVYVAAAVPATGKFTIYLSKAVTATTYVAFFILN